MPWAPELFTAPVLQRLLDKGQLDEVVDMPYFDGLMAGEPDALVESFAGEPELYDPVRGRIKGTKAFRAFVDEQIAWLGRYGASVEDVSRVVLEHRGFEEVVLHLDGEGGRVDLPVAIVAEHPTEARIEELRIYFSTRPLTGRHANRPPLLQPDPELRIPDSIAGTFEADGYARTPTGGTYSHDGQNGLRGFYEGLFANGGGIRLEHCSLIDDGRACALEYNVVRWGRAELPPQAGVAVYVRGESGKLAAARMYNDAEPPLGVGT
jgi:hypothetical protein